MSKMILDMDETINGWTNLGEHYRILLTTWWNVIIIYIDGINFETIPDMDESMWASIIS